MKFSFRRSPGEPSPAPRGVHDSPDVLMAVEDRSLAEQVRQIAAAAGRELHEISGMSPPRHWRNANLVILDDSAARKVMREQGRRVGETAVVFSTPPLAEGWQLAVAVKADHVLVLPQQERELVRVIGESTEHRVGSGRVVAAIGARGGSGCSTVSAAVALVSARAGNRTLAVDLDAQGGGLDVVLGMEKVTGLRWRDLGIAGGRVSATALHEALPTRGRNLALLSAGGDCTRTLEVEPALAVIDSARSAGDTVIVDLPRGWGELQQSVMAVVDCAVIVAPVEVRVMSALRSLVPELSRLCSQVGIIARGPAPGGVQLARVAKDTDLPLLGIVHHEASIALSAERGGLRLKSRSSLYRSALSIVHSSMVWSDHAGKASS